MSMATMSVTPLILSSVLAGESCIMLDEDGESFSNLSSSKANQSTHPHQDASNIITDDSKSFSEPSCDETAVHILDHCIVDSTPPQNRMKIQLTSFSIGV